MSNKPPRKTRSDQGKARKNTDDTIYTFRLDAAIPREAEAMAIINKYREQFDENGRRITLRQIMLEAVLALRELNMPDVGHSSVNVDELVDSFDRQLRRLDATISRLSEMNVSAQPAQAKRKAKSGLNLDYLQNLRSAINTGGDDD